MAYKTLRLTGELAERVKQKAELAGFPSASAFVRSVLIKSTTDPSQLEQSNAVDQSVSATLSRLSNDLEDLAGTQQITILLVDALVKTILTLIPEPSPETLAMAKGVWRERYKRLLDASTRSMDADIMSALLNGDLGPLES